MAVTPNSVVTTQAVKTARAVATAAKTTYNDATNAVLLLTAGANGALLQSLDAIPRATVTASMLQLYSSTDGGTTLILVKSVLMAAHTVAVTTAIPSTDFGYTESAPLRLAPNEKLYVATAVALAGGIVFNAGYEEF